MTRAWIAALAALVAWTSPLPAVAAEDPALSALFPDEAERATRGARVVGGIESPPDAYPFYNALSIKVSEKGYSLCGAAAIAPRWLLTAAHCVQETDPKTGRAAAIRSAGDLRAIPGGGSRFDGPIFGAVRIIPHPAYNSGHFLANDIALVELSAPVGPPYLPLPEAEPNPGAPVRIVGYGLTTYKGDTSKVLREADTRLVDRTTCQRAAQDKLKAYGPIDTRRICADVETKGGLVDSCQGDSGGPLLTRGPDGGWRAAGVVSYGYRCAARGYPGVYTNVAAYRSWIVHVVRGGDPSVTNPPRPTASSTTTAAAAPAKPKPKPRPKPAETTTATTGGSGTTGQQPQPAAPATAPTTTTQTTSTPTAAPAPTPAATPVATTPAAAPATPTATSQIAELLDRGGVTISGDDLVAPGDEVRFAVESELSGELFVFDIGKGGDARQIFPNERTRKGRAATVVRAARPRPVPAARDGFRLRAPDGSGDRLIVAIVVDGDRRLARMAEERELGPVADTGAYLREIVDAVAGPCGETGVRCAFGALRLRMRE